MTEVCEVWELSSGLHLDDHPLSITSTAGLLPTTWPELINKMYPPRGDKWMRYPRAELSDPNNWLIIPEFGVLPSEVNYQGFDYPLPWDRDLPSAQLRSLVATVRAAAIQEFDSLLDLKRLAQQAWHAQEAGHSQEAPHENESQKQRKRRRKQAIAEAYERVMSALIEFADRRLDWDSRVGSFADAVSVVADWVTNGPAAAMRSITAGARNGGEAGQRSRVAGDVPMFNAVAIVEAARRRGWPEKTRGIYKPLAQSFGCSASRIGQILREQEKKIVQ